MPRAASSSTTVMTSQFMAKALANVDTAAVRSLDAGDLDDGVADRHLGVDVHVDEVVEVAAARVPRRVVGGGALGVLARRHADGRHAQVAGGQRGVDRERC